MDTPEEIGEDVSLDVPVYIENDLKIDPDGNFIVQTFVFPDGNDEANSTEVRIKFSTLIKNVIEYCQEDPSAEATNTLYCIAHELTRQAEILRTKGDYMDRGVYSQDLFDEDKTNN